MESGHIKVDQMRKQYDFRIKVITTVMLTPPHIFTTDSGQTAEWNGNLRQESNNFTPVQEMERQFKTRK